MQDLHKVELDEIEILLSLLSQTDDISELTCDQTASLMQEKYQIECSGEEIFLLHEPVVKDVWYEDMYYYKNVLGL